MESLENKVTAILNETNLTFSSRVKSSSAGIFLILGINPDILQLNS